MPAEEWTTLQAGSSRVASNRVRRIRRSLGGGPAPVHAEVRAGDRSGFVTAQEKRDFAALLGKLEASLGLVQTSEEADAKDAY